MPDGNKVAQTLRENLAAIRAWDGPDEEKRALAQEQIQKAQGRINELSANDPERQRTWSDDLGAAAQAALSGATFGVEGLIEDALTKGGFRENRDLRKENRRALNERVQIPFVLPGGQAGTVGGGTAASVAGMVANPLNFLRGGALLKPVAEKTGLFGAALKTGTEGAAQAGAMAAGENIGTTEDPIGLMHAIPAAIVGGAAGGAMGAATRASNLLGLVRRAAGRKTLNLGERAEQIREHIASTSGPLFDKARAQADVLGTSPAIEATMRSQTVAPFAAREMTAEANAGLPPARLFMETYKGMSGAAKRAGKQVEGTPEYLHAVEKDIENIGAAKQRMLAVADKDIPAFREANVTHRTLKQEQKAFERGADMAERIITGKDLAGKKLLLNSPAAWEREIGGYTPREAGRALQGLLGRLKEVPELTSNPVGRFGVVSSTARMILAPSRLRFYADLLDRRARGMAGGGLFNMGIPGGAGRVAGGLLQY